MVYGGYVLWFCGGFSGVCGVMLWFVVFGVVIFLLSMYLHVISRGCIEYVLGWDCVCLPCVCFL